MDALPESLIEAVGTMKEAHDPYVCGELAEALRLFDHALDGFDRGGLRLGQVVAQAHQGRAGALVALGRADDALQACAHGVAALGFPGKEFDDPETRGALLGTTGLALPMQGEFARAGEAYGYAIEGSARRA